MIRRKPYQVIEAADSSDFHPTLAQLQAARAQGVRVWGFYLPGPGIYSGHTKADFDRIHQAGMKSIGWASGNADPAQQKALAASWKVDYPTLDDEPGIRAFGPWEQPWLETSGFGLYRPYGSDGSGFIGKRAPWLIMADYLGTYPYRDPQATWNGTPPAAPHGWQWAGTVQAFGGEVDRLWLDDWFLGDDMTQDEARALVRVTYMAGLGREPESEAVLAGAAADAMADGFEQMTTRILDSPEGQAWRAKLQASGSSLTAHTHDVSASTGQPK
jgi:hypothetical protein